MNGLDQDKIKEFKKTHFKTWKLELYKLDFAILWFSLFSIIICKAFVLGCWCKQSHVHWTVAFYIYFEYIYFEYIYNGIYFE